MVDLHGTCDERFREVRDALAESLAKDDVGASVAVFLHGEPVVDLWGGYADADRTVDWERDTITNVWSTTKTMIALCALILADRGELDLDAPLVRYWPEFASTEVRVRHVLSHTAGLPVWDTPITLGDLCDPAPLVVAGREPSAAALRHWRTPASHACGCHDNPSEPFRIEAKILAHLNELLRAEQ